MDTDIKSELDTEVFTCNKCGGKFNHIDGTWLPIGIEKKKFMNRLSDKNNEPPQVFLWDFSPPEIITSDKFTCYDCI